MQELAAHMLKGPPPTLPGLFMRSSEHTPKKVDQSPEGIFPTPSGNQAPDAERVDLVEELSVAIIGRQQPQPGNQPEELDPILPGAIASSESHLGMDSISSQDFSVSSNSPEIGGRKAKGDGESQTHGGSMASESDAWAALCGSRPSGATRVSTGSAHSSASTVRGCIRSMGLLDFSHRESVPVVPQSTLESQGQAYNSHWKNFVTGRVGELFGTREVTSHNMNIICLGQLARFILIQLHGWFSWTLMEGSVVVWICFCCLYFGALSSVCNFIVMLSSIDASSLSGLSSSL